MTSPWDLFAGTRDIDDDFIAHVGYWDGYAERTVAEIKWVERIFALPDARPLSPSDLGPRVYLTDQLRPSEGVVTKCLFTI